MALKTYRLDTVIYVNGVEEDEVDEKIDELHEILDDTKFSFLVHRIREH